MRVLGIDPGLRLTGYACIEPPPAPASTPSNGHTPRRSARTQSTGWRQVNVLEAGVFRLKQGLPVADRLVELEQDLAAAIDRLRPDTVAVEKVFSHYKHPVTAAIMGHARGVVLLVARKSGLQLVELGATEVKKSLTGNGHASKGQIQDAVAAQLNLATRPEPADVADAIAIALCCLRRAEPVIR